MDLGNLPAPSQVVDTLTLRNLRGSFSSFGRIAGPAKATIRNVTLQDLELTLQDPKALIRDVDNLVMDRVAINGRTLTAQDVLPPADPAGK